MEEVMERKGFIGGSDAVKIMNGDWIELWEIKTGRMESPDLSKNLAVQMGILTEDFNISWFEQEYNKTVVSQQYEILRGGTVGDDMPPLKGTLDGLVKRYNDIIECKHTNAFNNMEKVMSYYMPQVQLYMYLAKANGCYLSVFFGNSKWECNYISYDDSYMTTVLDMIKDFWSYVKKDEEPPYALNTGIVQATQDKIPVENMIKRDANLDNEFMSVAHDYIENQPSSKLFEGAKKSLKQMVGANEREVYCDRLTIRRNKRGALTVHVREETS
tara:strand:- start:492 stop:1307 length:816 start_codon:yes stop_codon:yes gene_type:complete